MRNYALSYIRMLSLAYLFLGLATTQSKGEKTQGVLLLQSGFEEGVEVSEDMERITGSETGIGSWESPGGWVDSSKFVYLVSRGKDPSMFMDSAIETVQGRDGRPTKALRMTNIADDPDQGATSRNEFSFFGKTPPEDYQEGYVRYWMKLQGNLLELFPVADPSLWYMIMEWKEPNSKIRKTREECLECCRGRAGGSNNYRINVGLSRSANATKFNWIIRGEHPQPCRVTEWIYVNPKIGVPLGEWFQVEAYMKKSKTDGRVYFAINNQVILDTEKVRPDGFTGRTTHPDNPMTLKFWSTMKNYHHMSWNKEGPISQWYDDFELWTGFPPNHPASIADGN